MRRMLRSIRRSSAAFLFLSVLASSVPASALTITFDNFVGPAGTSAQLASSVGIAGYLIDAPSGELFIDQAGYLNRPDNGSANLVARRFGAGVVDLRITTQSVPFDLIQMDLAELFNPGVNDPLLTAQQILVTGVISGGGIVQQQILLDNISDGPGGVADFETFAFDGSWTNLTQVVLRGTSPTALPVHLKVDNIELEATVIPEPSTAFLLGLGLVGLAIRQQD